MNQSSVFFIILWCLLLITIFSVLFRILPGEKWQFMAALPIRKKASGRFESKNITWYGFFTATSIVYAVILMFLFATSCDINAEQISVFCATILAIAIPSAKLIAAIVEKRKGTITIGGAAFAALLFAPPAAYAINMFNERTGASGILLSSMAIAYIAGEGFGRLACLSFGCCYGKKITECGYTAQKIFANLYFTFNGALKKSSYDGKSNGKKLIPIQGITAIFLSSAAVTSSILFFSNHMKASFLTAICCGFGWRFLSEFLRSDHRGSSQITHYQWMSILAVIYCIAVSFLIGFDSSNYPDLSKSLPVLSDVKFILVMQFLWLFAFLYTGVSTVTKSEIQFYLDKKRN